jgi:hypothetical protein
MNNLFSKTNRSGLTTDYLDRYMKDHEDFIKQYSDDIYLSITDEQFRDRLKISAEALQKFIEKL